MGELFANKVIGACLATVLFIFGVNELSLAVFGGGHHGHHEYASLNNWAEESFPGYHIPIADSAGGAAEEEEGEPFDLGLMLANADVSAGEASMRQCAACHNWNAGGAHGTGPNLHSIMGEDIAGKAGYTYSSALAGIDGAWTYEAMNEWLINPGGFARGNKMSFAGLRSPRKDEERVNIIAYLASQTPGAPAFPEPLAAASEEG